MGEMNGLIKGCRAEMGTFKEGGAFQARSHFWQTALQNKR